MTLLSSPTGNSPRPEVLRVAIAAVTRHDEVLVVARRAGSGRPTEGGWQFPAGMIKPGAESRTVAIAETFAETGVHCVHVRDLGARLHPVTSVHCEYFLCDYIAGEVSNRDAAENSAAMWVSTRQLPKVIPPSEIFAPLRVELGRLVS